jgi:hypothetical protein
LIHSPNQYRELSVLHGDDRGVIGQREERGDRSMKSPRKRLLVWWSLGFALLFLILLATFAHQITRPIEPNENMYVAASALAMDQDLYRDFAFVQMPYLPHLYAFLYSVSDTTQYLLCGRLVTWLTFLATIGCVAGIAWHFSRDIVIAISSVLIFVCCDSVILITGECSNYALASCLSLASYWLFVARRDRIALFFVGILLGIAVCVKLYYAVLVPVFALATWFRLNRPERRFGLTLLFLVGVAIAVLPAFYSLIGDPDRFMFNNLGFHRWKTQVYLDTGYGARMTLHDRIQHGKSCLQHASQMWILYTAVIAVWTLFRRRDQWQPSSDLLLACSLAGITLLAALVPVPAWSQYFAMPVPFLLVIAIQLAGQNLKPGRLLLTATAVAGLVVSGPYYVRAINALGEPVHRTPLVLHDESQKLIEQIDTDHPLIATTCTLIALEGGGRIYNEWALSGFMFELSDHAPEDMLEKYRVTSPKTFHKLLAKRPPDAILARDNVLDAPLSAYAQSRGFRRIENAELGVTLWLPPESKTGSASTAPLR